MYIRPSEICVDKITSDCNYLRWRIAVTRKCKGDLRNGFIRTRKEGDKCYADVLVAREYECDKDGNILAIKRFYYGYSIDSSLRYITDSDLSNEKPKRNGLPKISLVADISKNFKVPITIDELKREGFVKIAEFFDSSYKSEYNCKKCKSFERVIPYWGEDLELIIDKALRIAYEFNTSNVYLRFAYFKDYVYPEVAVIEQESNEITNVLAAYTLEHDVNYFYELDLFVKDDEEFEYITLPDEDKLVVSRFVPLCKSNFSYKYVFQLKAAGFIKLAKIIDCVC